MAITMDEMATFCRRKGFVFPSCEIYGGLSGFFDYGPLGVELKNNLKAAWWKYHVNDREDIVGIDGAIVNHPKVWVASGHVSNFADILVECLKCHERFRADTLAEDVLKIRADGLKAKELDALLRDNKVTCPKCKGLLGEASPFNLMFKTFVGPKTTDDNIAYLRPETAQLMFTNFRNVLDTGRVKLPFGIAQMGKAFRNEISPRNFLFRCREFEQMEIEYFIHPEKSGDCPFIQEALSHSMLIWSAEDQKANRSAVEMTMSDALAKGIIKTPWHAYWLANEHNWFISLGVKADHLRARQHIPDELAHYALDTWDLEYEFPFGWKELQGIANRKDFDLKQHSEHSGQQLTVFDEETKKHIMPYVVCEPSQGVDRAFLVFLFDAYGVEASRDNNIVLRLHPKLAPFKVGVFPLVNKLDIKAREVFASVKNLFPSFYDKSGSIGRRYARADEIGVPWCVTVDFDTLEKGEVTLRDRDSTSQVRVPLDSLTDVLRRLVAGEMEFADAGTPAETRVKE